jgi:CBS domain-containing membrane protein
MKTYEMTVSDLMSTALLTVKASDPLIEARADMEIGVVRHLPVVDDRGRLVGIVSDRDLVRTPARRKVADVMSRDIVTARPEEPAHVAASHMLEHRIGSIPVVDDDGALLGVVTVTDYLALARRALLGLPLER